MLDIVATFGLLASAITANKIVLQYMSPGLLVAIRMLLAGSVLFAYNLYTNKFNFLNKLKPNIFNLLVIALCTTLLPAILKAYALKNMQSSKAAFFGNLDPFITAILAYFILSEKITLQKLIGIFVGFLGLYFLNFSSHPTYSSLDLFVSSKYELAALLAIIISRFGWLIAQKLLKRNSINPVELNSFTMLISGALALIFSYNFESLSVSNPDNRLYLNLLYTTVIGNIFAYNLYAHLLKKHTATLISFSSFLVPIFVQIFGYFFLSEPLSIYFFISCLITFIGFVVFNI